MDFKSTTKCIIETCVIWQTSREQPSGNFVVMTTLGNIYNTGFFSHSVSVFLTLLIVTLFPKYVSIIL